MYFDELNLNDNVLDALYDMHFDTCTPIQERCIPEILEGKDVLGVAQTGTGKTAAYLLPILSKIDDGGYPEDSINCIVMSPTRELAQQIDQAMQGFSYYLDGVSSIAVYGGNDGIRYDQELKSLSLGANVVIATPGRFISHMSLGNVDLSKVSFFVLDEADRMLDMGFSDDILKIAKKLPDTCQTIMFSATMPEKIEQLAKTLLKNPVEIKLAVSKPAEKIKQTAYVCYETQKMGVINDIFKAGNLNRVIIFSGSKQKVKQISGALLRHNINSGEMHSDLDQTQRDDMMFRFKSGQIDVLVATDILARGIDIDDITMVINYDVPKDVEDYVHRIGRTARADRNGCAITFVNENDIYYFKQIEKFLNKDIEKLALPEGLGDGPKYEIKKGEKRNGSKSHNDKRRNSIRNSKHKAKTEEKSNKTSTQSDKSDANVEKTGDIKDKNNRRNNSKHDEKSKEKKQKEKKQETVKNNNTEQKDRTKKSERNKKTARNNKSDKTEMKAETPKNKEANKPKKKKRVNKPVTSHQEKVHKKSSKYAIPNDYPMPAKEESGIKSLLKKPLKWLKSLKK